ncbi:MAG: molybdenum cofactor guanylyltransferase [Elusimicrobia bacterium]|nr:molybdenum cofactor guanylyltransferase [Elusimicrobiota bacterium]
MGGKDKAFLYFEGQPLIQRTISVLQPVFSEIFVVTNFPRSYDQYAKEATIIADRIKEMGPLGGIYTALSQTLSAAVFFVAGDMPFLHTGIIKQQIREFEKMAVDVFVPRIGNRLEPLHGIYRQRISKDLFSFLRESQRHSVREFLQKVETAYWELDDTAAKRAYFTNVNTPEELQKITGPKFKEGGECKDRHKGIED